MNSSDTGRRVLRQEAAALERLAGLLGEGFSRAVEVILSSSGKVAVAGMGKSGLVGRKIAATLSSTGTPAFFLHAAESLHGDIGVLTGDDVVVALSFSGKTGGIDVFLSAVSNIGAKIIAITGDKDSPLASGSDAVILIDIEKEACPFNLAPTTSTTAMLAVGDALALALLERRGFRPEDFASRHPGGTLGRRLLLRAGDLAARKKVNPVLEKGRSVKEALLVMTSARSGAASIVDSSGVLVGYFTDGDLRRHIQEDEELLTRKIEEVMTKDPVTLTPECPAVEAKDILRKNSFDNLPVIDSSGRPVGIVDERDIIEAGL